MTEDLPTEGAQDDQDRVVSRRVDNPTDAAPGDAAAYEAANPTQDGGAAAPTPSGGTPGASSADAADEMAEENESEPERSE